MSLNKKQMVREIGRRTRLKNRDVQAVVETLVEVWTDELIRGGRIELENFLVLEVTTVEQGTHTGTLFPTHRQQGTSPVIRHIKLKLSKRLKSALRK